MITKTFLIVTAAALVVAGYFGVNAASRWHQQNLCENAGGLWTTVNPNDDSTYACFKEGLIKERPVRVVADKTVTPGYCQTTTAEVGGEVKSCVPTYYKMVIRNPDGSLDTVRVDKGVWDSFHLGQAYNG